MGQRLAAGILKKSKALDISLIIYHWKAFSSLILKKKTQEILIILYKAVIYQKMTSLI